MRPGSCLLGRGLATLKVRSPYLDGELCALDSNGAPVFCRLQEAMDEGQTDQLLFFVSPRGSRSQIAALLLGYYTDLEPF